MLSFCFKDGTVLDIIYDLQIMEHWDMFIQAETL